MTALNAVLRLTAALLCCASLSSTLAYTVQPGDTLFSIARTNGLTVAELQRLNQLSGTSIKVGQQLRLNAQEPLPALPVPELQPSPSTPVPAPESTSPEIPPVGPGPSAPVDPPNTPPLSPVEPSPIKPVPSPASLSPSLVGVSVSGPAKLRMGDAFLLHLTGPKAAEATVRFTSEIGEDVRQPAETLRPFGAAGEYVVLGRVVLGKTTPLVYEVRLQDKLIRRSIPVLGLNQPTQHLNLPERISRVLNDPERAAEDAAVEQAYARRGPQLWSKPFRPALNGTKGTSSGFGQPRTYTAGGQVMYHFGTDDQAPVGTSVQAVNDGLVIIAGRYPVRGGLVVIDHGAGVTSLYFHQSKILVRPGQRVNRGQKIGEVGSTGLSAGPHLHLEMRVRGEGTDPRGWMNRLWP